MRALLSLKTAAVAVFIIMLFTGIAASQTVTTVDAASDFEVQIDLDTESVSASCPPKTSKHMWFYKPPTEGTSVEKLIKKSDIYVLTRYDEDYLSQIRNAGEGPVLQYIKFDAISDACFQAKKAKGTPCSCSIEPRSNQVASKFSDICNIRDNHPDWFLRDKKGNLIYWNEFVMMDPGNQGWREFWLSRIKSYQAEYPKWGGVFMDNMSTLFGRHGTDFVEMQKYPTEKSYQDAVIGFINYGQSNYFKSTNRIMYANLSVRWGHQEPFVRYIQSLDGAMDEFWSVPESGWYSVNAWEARVWRAQEALKRGKSMMLVAQGSRTDYQRQLFAFASYLLVSGDKTYFRYTSNAADSGYSQLWVYDNYKARLGAPIGYYIRSGNTWTRKFTNGKVTVNPETRQASIKVKDGC